MTVILDGRCLTAADVVAVADGARVVLADEARERVARNHVEWCTHGGDVLARKEALLVGLASPDAPAHTRVTAFVEGHCAGVGAPLPKRWVRALMVCRANVFAAGFSGVRPELIDLLLAMLDAGVHPVVPRQGSVGAAGDLAPLAHLARVAFRLGGTAERDGTELEALAAMAGLPDLTPEPKEALALINGVSLSTGLAAFACVRARRLLESAELALAMTMEAVHADADCLTDWTLSARGHPGAVGVAGRVRALLDGSVLVHHGRHPDAFSIRCAPTVLGSAWDALGHIDLVVGRELNGASDNPLVNASGVAETGNFHGAPIGLVMDLLKIALTQVATSSERRTFRMTYGKLAGNLPSFLVRSTGVNSGFMLAQYTAASLASECKGLAHPASVDTIPTAQHHEDHVSMAPIAARGAISVIDNVAEVLAIEILAAGQALEFRQEGVSFTEDGSEVEGPAVALAPGVDRGLRTLRARVPRWVHDRVLHRDLAAVSRLVRDGAFATTQGPW